jgi:cell division protease FtsH
MNEDQPTGNPWMKNLLVWGGIFLALVFAVSLFGSRGDVGATQMPIPISAPRWPRARADAAIGEQRISGHFKNGDAFTTVPVPNDVTLQPLFSSTM